MTLPLLEGVQSPCALYAGFGREKNHNGFWWHGSSRAATRAGQQARAGAAVGQQAEGGDMFTKRSIFEHAELHGFCHFQKTTAPFSAV